MSNRLPAIHPSLPQQCAHRVLHLAVAVAALSIQSIQPVYAQSVQQIDVVGRQVNLVGSASTASEGLVSQDELALRPLLRTGEILESVPGLVATQHSGSGKANQFFLRGFNLDHGTDFATHIDGMPINMRSHGHGQGYTDLNFIIPEMVKEIEYRKGSYYADVGDFSGAGSAHISSMDSLTGQQVSLAVGEQGFARLLATGGLAATDGQFLYGVEHQIFSGPWDAIDEDIGKTNVWLKRQWQRDDAVMSLTFMGYDNSWNSADQIPARAVSNGVITEFGSVDPTVGGNSSRYSVSGNWQHQRGNTRFSAAAYAIDYDMELWSNFSYNIDEGGDQFRQIDDRRIYGGNVEALLQSSLGDMRMENTLGAQLRIDNIAQVGLNRSLARVYTGPIRRDAVDQSNTGVFWSNTLHWTDNLRSVFGARYDYYDFEVNALDAADVSTLAANSGTADDDIFTANFSMIYTFNANSEIYASIGEGFHSNDARGTTIAFDPVSGDAIDPVDPLVSTLGSEIGLRLFFNDRLNASLALWQLDIDSELIFVGDAGNTEDTGVGSERQGLELTAYYQLNEQFSFDAEYSYTDAQYEQTVDGLTSIAGALEHVVSGGLNYRPNDRVNAHLRLRHFAEFPLDGGVVADGSTLLNLRVGYQATDNFSLNLDVLNILDSTDHDVEYFYESQLPWETAPVEDRHYHVFTPRALRLYASYRF